MNQQTVTAHPSTPSQTQHLETSEILLDRILVGTDFSKHAQRAVRVAAQLGHVFDAKLTVVCAMAPIVSGIYLDPAPVESLDADLNAARARMNGFVASEPELGALKPELIVAYGAPVSLITEFAQDAKAKLIVMGSHGANPLERLALGSVAESVMHRTSCPVLIVGPHCRVEPHLFRSVLFATDLKTTGLRGAQYAAGLAERFHGNLTFLHVLDQKYETPSPEHEGMQAHAREELERLIPSDAREYCRVKTRVGYGKPAETITAVAQSESASMIVIGLRDRILADHAPWSTLSHIIRESRCPVLAVRGHLAKR